MGKVWIDPLRVLNCSALSSMRDRPQAGQTDGKVMPV